MNTMVMPPELDCLTVLIVDDQPAIRDLLRTGMQVMGAGTILEARDARSALTVMAAEEIDVILCDWNMPHTSGLAFLRHVRERHPHLPFIMMTARGDEEALNQAKDAGVSTFLRKPFTAEHLEEHLHRALRQAAH